METQLDKPPLDLRSCRVPRAPAHRVSVPARSDAPHFPAGVGLGCGALFGLLDNRLAVAESVDARQCCAQSFLGDGGLQLGLRGPRRLAPVLYCACTTSGTDLTSRFATSKFYRKVSLDCVRPVGNAGPAPIERRNRVLQVEIAAIISLRPLTP